MKKYLSILAAPALVMGLWGCDVEQTEEGSMPEVQVEGGNLPKYDVDAPDVDVNSKPAEVTVPNVDINTETKTIEVPDVNVTMPKDGDAGGDLEAHETPSPATTPAPAAPAQQ